MRELFARLRDWLRRDQLDAELKEELRFHRERLERDARAGGVAPADAAYSARRRLGNVTRVREEARDRWAIPGLDAFQQDVRYAFRGLRKSPGFTAAVVLTLGLGIGANVAMFGVIDPLMFRPYPYLRDPASVHRVYLRIGEQERLLHREIFPYTRYLDLTKWTTSFSAYAAFSQAMRAVGTGEATRERPILAVSASFFDFFNARPAAGRFFAASEDVTPAGANVAVLGFAFWKTEFGGRDMIGQSIQVATTTYTIIGVTPKDFVGVSDGAPPAVFVPITTFGAIEGGGSSTVYYTQYNWDWTEMMVRRKPGVTLAAATSDLTNAFIRSRVAARALNPRGPQVERYHPSAVPGALKTGAGPYPGLEARTLVWVAGVAVIVMLIACANVANLCLARALRRRREVALRLALGVTRGRLLAQSLTESMVLSVMGCVVGIAVAQWGGLALRRLFLPATSPFDLLTDLRTLSLAVGAALVAGLLTGIAPVILTRRDDLARTLKAGAREGTYQRSRLRSTLLVLQGALSVVLLVGAGVFVRSLGHVRDMRLGYDVNSVLMVEWNPRGTPMSPTERATFRQRLVEAARAIPGVEHAAWVSSVPFQGTSIHDLLIPGIDSASRLGRFTFQTAGSDYFATMGTRILRGRSFKDADGPSAPNVAVVSEGMARLIWPGKEVLGQCMRIGYFGVKADTMPCTTVVGIAEDAVHDPAADQPLRYYLPVEQVPLMGGSTLLVRMHEHSTAGASARAEDVRRTLQREMPGQSYVTVRPSRELVDDQRRSWQVGATMFVAFGILALVVAAVGLYGVIAYDVAQRMHEIGVRVALGAQGRDVLRLVVGQGVRFAVAGVGVGSALAFLAARWIQPLLFQQSARDPAVFGVVGALLIGVGLVASFVPASRATRADPNSVLRAE